ncbi:MAG: hypothetical protein WDO68_16500 [Gammaproteobacteria bacterium]
MSRFLLVCCCSATLMLTACVTTTFTSTWKAPDAQGVDPTGKKVAAVYMTKDESSRRAAEDVLARKLTERGAQGVAAYTIVETSAASDVERTKKQLSEAGVDGVVIMRVLGEKERTRVTYGGPPWGYAPYYSHFSSYWGFGWGAPYSPTEVTTTTELRIETLVYSLTRDELLWAGTSRTTDPGKISSLVDEIADSAAKEMTKQGVLKARPN